MTQTDDKSMELIGQIMSANVAALAHTTNTIEAGLRATIRFQAQTLLEVLEILDDATVIDRRTEWRLEKITHRLEAAHDTLLHVDRLEEIANG